MLTWLIEHLKNTIDRWKLCIFLKIILMLALKENWLFTPRIYKFLHFLIGKLYFQPILVFFWSTTFHQRRQFHLCWHSPLLQKLRRLPYKGGFVACNVISLTLFSYDIYGCRRILKHVSKSYSFRVARDCRRRVVGLINMLLLEL